MQTKLSWGRKNTFANVNQLQHSNFHLWWQISDGTRGSDFRHHVEEVQTSERMRSHFDRKLDYRNLMHQMTEQNIGLELAQVSQRDRAVLQTEVLNLVVLKLSSKNRIHSFCMDNASHCGQQKMTSCGQNILKQLKLLFFYGLEFLRA